MNIEPLIEALTCQLDSENKNVKKHLVKNPKFLPCCRRLACNDCIVKAIINKNSASSPSHYYYDCLLCQSSNKIRLSGDECQLDSCDDANQELDRYMIEINHYLIKKLESIMSSILDRFESKEIYLRKRKEFIHDEIHTQVQSIKNYLDQLEVEMKESLENSTKNMLINIEKYENQIKDDINAIKKSINNLKANQFSYANNLKEKHEKNISSIIQNESVDVAMVHLHDLIIFNSELSETFEELRFDPNNDLPKKSLIGHLKRIKELNFKEQFKTLKAQIQITRIQIPNFENSGALHKVPISPKFLCIKDKNNLLFTDSQSKQIVQLRLDTGDFIRWTNLNGLIKNPEGICINREGFIYVTDAETNQVFKLDRNLILIKKFGSRDLKWPRGIAYDDSDPAVIDCIYICDFANQRIAIYNDHEQLRDSITVALYDHSNANNSITEERQNRNKLHTVEEENRFHPLNVSIDKSSVYVTDDWTGGNCVRIFDKKSFCLLRNVGHLNAWNPLGLIVDDSASLFTMARLYYETGSTSLFCFNSDGDLMYKTNLNLNSELITDIVVDRFTDKFNNRIICAGEKKLHIFKF